MSQDKCGIYEIQCRVSGKSYVGSSKSIYSRWSAHRRDLRKKTHASPRLQRAWNKHGEENFSFSILEECSQDQLFTREQFHIDAKTRDYNSMQRVRVVTPEMRRKMTATLAAHAAAITHCPSGHEYTPENTKHMRNKWRTRQCRECARIRTRNALEVETPEQAADRLRKCNEYHTRNREHRLKLQREYTVRTKEQKQAYDRDPVNLAKKRERRAKARAEGRAYG